MTMPMFATKPGYSIQCAHFIDTTIYNPPEDSGATTEDSATYTFTPGTSDNVIIGILWRCDLTTTSAFSIATAMLKLVPQTDLVGDCTETSIYSRKFCAVDNNKTETTHWMWVSNGNWTETADQDKHTFSMAGYPSYQWILRTGARDAADRVRNVEFKVFYIDRIANKEGYITVA